MKQDKSVNSPNSNIVVGEGKPPWFRQLKRSLWQSKKLALPVGIVLILLLVATSSYFAFFKHEKKKAPQKVLTPLSQLEYKPTETDKTIKQIANLFQANKSVEAQTLADQFATTASDRDKRAVYAVVAGYCHTKKDYACESAYYSKAGRDNLQLSQLLNLAEALEQSGKKTEAKELFTYIHNNKSKLYDQLEAKDQIDKRVNDGLQRLGT